MIDPKPLKRMIDKARKAMENACAPYSDYRVGACALSSDGNLYAGCNVENASYGLCVCAERNAIAHMVAEGERSLTAIVVMGTGPDLTTPCGACRQVIREFAAPGLLIYVCGPEGVRRRFTLDELLPYSFGPDNLKGDLS
ncbi:MAG: cytidine deaminase [Pseudomonadota bacterium]|nr:cytidine deaminase [Pseudomonadota bacterium]